MLAVMMHDSSAARARMDDEDGRRVGDDSTKGWLARMRGASACPSLCSNETGICLIEPLLGEEPGDEHRRWASGQVSVRGNGELIAGRCRDRGSGGVDTVGRGE